MHAMTVCSDTSILITLEPSIIQRPLTAHHINTALRSCTAFSKSAFSSSIVTIGDDGVELQVVGVVGGRSTLTRPLSPAEQVPDSNGHHLPTDHPQMVGILEQAYLHARLAPVCEWQRVLAA